MISNNNISLEKNLSFENLSSLLYDLEIITHPLTNEQKVCIEYPNINIENKDINIFEKEVNSNDKFINDEFTLTISKNNKYIINPKKLFEEFSNIPYSFKEFKNSLKIFVSIFNSFNEDIFKWNLEEFNLFNNDNIIQFIEFNNNNYNKEHESEDILRELYKKHFSVKIDMQNAEILEISSYKNDTENIKEKNKIDDFEDDFTNSDKNVDNLNTEKLEQNSNSNLFCYEKDNIFRNIYFLVNIFNIMNRFYIYDYNLENILKNISLFNSFIINDHKILILIYFYLSIQINLYIKKTKVDEFLNIKGNEKEQNNNKIIIKENDKYMNNYIPNIFYIDFQIKELSKEENEVKKDKIILFNNIIKIFNLAYFNNIFLKLNIKIFSLTYFLDIKSKLLLAKNYFNNNKNINYIIDFIPNINIIQLFNNDLNNFSIISFVFILPVDININDLSILCENYYPLINKSHIISFDTLENDSIDKKYPLNNYLLEIDILIWSLKFILKTVKSSKKFKLAFSFVFNSFSIALKKDKNNEIKVNIQDLMIYMGIYHYNEKEMIKFLGEEKNYNILYRQYKEILKCCAEYKSYNINIRLFKNGITNNELKYHFISIILNILNNIKIKNKDFYKNISLYESKFINTIKCIFIHIKKQNKEIGQDISNINDNIEFENKSNELSSSKIQRSSLKDNNLLKKFNIFNKNKKENHNNIVAENNNLNALKDDEENNNIIKENKNIANKLNNFYKNLSACNFLRELESKVLIKFFKSVKNYFTDFMFYIEKINLQNINNSKDFIFEKTSDSSISFDPINILRNFNNNKCFIILKEFSYIDLYVYLYDFYENNVEDENLEPKSKKEICNDIFHNISILKEKCYNNFKDKKSSIVIGKINFILHKYFLILNLYFDGNKFFFGNENNNIIILDKFTNTDCIIDCGHINIILNNINDSEKNENKDKINEDNYFMKFYSAFLYEYDIVKYIIEKKLRKIKKLNIIIKRKILQFNNGKIQLKKINLKKNNNKKINNENKENNFINEAEKIINSKQIYNETYNLFKIRNLFKYENSYPLIIFFLENETEISNFAFLLFSFSEIFLNKSSKELTKELIIKRIIQFFNRFRSSKFIPIIFNNKYFQYFLELFNILGNKLTQKNINNSLDSPKKNNNNLNKVLFENIIFYPINNINLFSSDEINNNILNSIILKTISKKIFIYQIDNNDPINYTINKIGKMFKLSRIGSSLSELEKSSNITPFQGSKIIFICYINSKNLKLLIKKNQKKVKFIGVDDEDRSLNVHVFNYKDTLKKYKLENENDNKENCTIF